MAANTPVIHAIAAGAGYRLHDRIMVTRDAYGGAGTLVENYWQWWTNSGATVLKWESGLIANDDETYGDGWAVFWPAGMRFIGNTSYWLTDINRNSSAETSGKSAAVEYALGAARLGGDRWLQAI